MIKSLQDRLLAATVRTFEGLAFMMVARPDEDEEIPESFEAGVRVRFEGIVGGTLSLVARRGILTPLATNMLGDDAAAQPSLAVDALGEAANVICGNVLSTVDDGGRCFRLDAPARITREEAEKARKTATARVAVSVDDGRAEVIIHLEQIPAELAEPTR